MKTARTFQDVSAAIEAMRAKRDAVCLLAAAVVYLYA